MARVPYMTKEEMAPEHQHIWDEIGGSRGGVAPNYQALLNGPLAAARLADLGAYARFEIGLDPRIRRLAALTTAREADGDYVWTVNVPQAVPEGISEATVAAIHQRRAPEGLSPGDGAVVSFVQELLRNHKVSDATYASIQQRLGNAGVVDLLVLTGYYWTLSHCLSGLEVEPPGGSTL